MAAKKAAPKKAAPRKAAKKTAKKTSVVESWTEGYRPLIDAARQHFGFLVREHGFTEPEVDVTPPAILITFSRGPVAVRIESERMDEPFITVRASSASVFALRTVMAQLEPEYAARKPAPAGSRLTPDEMRAAVAYDAAFLARHPELLRL